MKGGKYMNKNLTEKIYNDMTKLLKEKNLIKSIPSLTIVDSFKEADCKAYIVTHEVNGIEKYDIYVNDASYDDIVKNLKTNKEKSINDLFSLVDDLAHELAHMTEHNHGDAHKKLTMKYREVFHSRYLQGGSRKISKYIGE